MVKTSSLTATGRNRKGLELLQIFIPRELLHDLSFGSLEKFHLQDRLFDLTQSSISVKSFFPVSIHQKQLQAVT